jgi:hypothetical protein
MHLDKIDVMKLYDISKHNRLGQEMTPSLFNWQLQKGERL